MIKQIKKHFQSKAQMLQKELDESEENCSTYSRWYDEEREKTCYLETTVGNLKQKLERSQKQREQDKEAFENELNKNEREWHCSYNRLSEENNSLKGLLQKATTERDVAIQEAKEAKTLLFETMKLNNALNTRTIKTETITSETFAFQPETEGGNPESINK